MKIIIIEDNKHFAETIAKMMKKDWNEVIIFNKISDFVFEEADIFIIDIQMEELSFWLISDIRNKTINPVIVFSNFSNVEYKTQAHSCWVDVYFEKLTQPKAFYESVNALHRMNLRYKKYYDNKSKT